MIRHFSHHFEVRFQERVLSLNLSKEIKTSIRRKILERVIKSRYSSESICIYKFDIENDLPRYDNENELWVTIRNQVVTTILRRNENDRKFTSKVGFKVENIEYDLINKNSKCIC